MIINKNTKIFLAIFTVVLICITAGTIFYKNSQKSNDNESHIIIEGGNKIPEPSIEDIYEQNSTDNYKLSLNDTYSNNGLKFKIVDDDSKNVKVSYVQISGLKDEGVQESINDQIKERINKIIDSNNFKKNSDNTAYIKTTVEANFSDVLSIKISARFKEDYNKSYGLNFRLDTGDKIKFSDLFTYSAPKKNIITNSAYRTFALDYYTDEGISNEFYSNIEDDLINFLCDYNNGKITEFSFTPLTIELYRNGKTVIIDMSKYYEYIAIYDKFVSNTDLYNTVDHVASKIPVFVSRPDSIYDLYEKINDSCIIDVIIYGDEDFSNKELKVIGTYKKNLVERLKEIRNERGLYYSNYVKVKKDVQDGENILIFDENECYALVRENNFADQVYSKIMMAERDINKLGSNECKIHVLEKGMLKSGECKIKYNVKTGLEISDEEEKKNNNEGENTDSRNTNGNGLNSQQQESSNNQNTTQQNNEQNHSNNNSTPQNQIQPSQSSEPSPTPTPRPTPTPTTETSSSSQPYTQSAPTPRKYNNSSNFLKGE